MTDYANINEQIRIMRHDIPSETLFSTQKILAKSTFLKNRNTSKPFLNQSIEASHKAQVEILSPKLL
jgi:hypothetical protein